MRKVLTAFLFAGFLSGTVRCDASPEICQLGDALCHPVSGFLVYSNDRWAQSVPRFLYVSNNGSSTISRYRIDADGLLTHLGDTATPGPPWDLTVNASSTRLYIAGDVTATTNNTITVYSIDAGSGDLRQIANVFHGDSTNQYGPWDILLHPNGKYLYSSNADQGNGDSLSTFDLDGDGIPSFRSFSSTAGLQPAGLVISPDLQYIYAGLVNVSAGVGVFQIQSDGTAAYQSNTASCAAASTNIYDIALNPTGSVLYSGSGGGVNGCAYLVPASGTVNANASYTHNLNFRSGMKFSTRGDTLFIANDMSEVLTYVIDSTTGLIGGSGPTFLTGVSGTVASPNGRDIVVDETGRFVYALNDDGKVFAYRTDETQGFIDSQIQQTTAGATPRYAAIAYFEEE